MITLNLKTSNKAQEQIKKYLEANASEILADKINNGVKIVKDNKTLINKKDLNGFWKYATEQARQYGEKADNGAYVDDETVFGWAIHYFEEETIEGTLFNEDGSEYKPITLKANTTTINIPKPIPKKENTQASLFDLLSSNTETKQKENLSYKGQLSKYAQPDPLDEQESCDDDEEFTEEEQCEALEQLHNEQKEEFTKSGPKLEIIENNNEKVTIDTTTGEVLSKEQIENSFDKKSLFILMNYLPELEMR